MLFLKIYKNLLFKYRGGRDQVPIIGGTINDYPAFYGIDNRNYIPISIEYIASHFKISTIKAHRLKIKAIKNGFIKRKVNVRKLTETENASLYFGNPLDINVKSCFLKNGKRYIRYPDKIKTDLKFKKRKKVKTYPIGYTCVSSK